MSSTAIVHLKKGEDARILGGHLWVFSNEIARIDGAPADGDLVRIAAHNGAMLGVGFYNRHSLIAIRVVSRETGTDLSQRIPALIAAANARRTRLGYSDVYRMVNGEADQLPGLIVDRYADVLVVESYSAGIDAFIPVIVEALEALTHPTTIIEKSLSIWREYEGIPQRQGFLRGNTDDGAVRLGGLTYQVRFLEGQKTGLFLDQEENRARVEALSRDRRVLDCCCNDGGFSLHAARGGARSVTGVDSSAGAVERARNNAAANGLHDIAFIEEDAFEYLDRTPAGTFDLVIVDPPAFVKSRKKLAPGLKGYQKLNEKALRTVADGGILVSCTCSSLVTPDMYLETLARAAARAGKTLSVFQISGAGRDHPFHPSMPETRYLTCVWAFVGTRG